jgi:nitrate reductase delta subunit
MTATQRKLRLLAALLQYPDRTPAESAPALGEEATALWGEGISDFICCLLASDLLPLQEAYTATFDMNPATCLNLTYHRWADSEDRSRALSEMAGAYGAAGLGPAGGELPDFLPMAAELLSTGPPVAAARPFAGYHEEIEILTERLAEGESPYAPILAAMAEAFRAGLIEAGISPEEGTAAVRKRDRAGTGTEHPALFRSHHRSAKRPGDGKASAPRSTGESRFDESLDSKEASICR